MSARELKDWPAFYSFRVEDLGPDDHADTPEGASLLEATAEGRSGRIEGYNDSDFFRVEALAGHAYRVSCSSPDMRCGLKLHGPDRPTSDTESGLEVRATGPFAVEVFAADGSQDKHYTVRLVDLGSE